MITIRHMPTLYDILEPHVPSRIGVFPYPDYKYFGKIRRDPLMTLDEWRAYECAEFSRLCRNRNRWYPGKNLCRGKRDSSGVVVMIRR